MGPDDEVRRRARDEALVRKQLGGEIFDDMLHALAALPTRVADIDIEVTRLTERVESNHGRLDRLEAEIDKAEARLSQRLDQTQTRIDMEVENKRQLSRGVLFALLGVSGTLLGIALTIVAKATGVI